MYSLTVKIIYKKKKKTVWDQLKTIFIRLLLKKQKQERLGTSEFNNKNIFLEL